MSDTFVWRPRLFRRLAAAATRRVTLARVPDGFGMSTVLREHARRLPAAYVCLRERTTLARLGGDLAEALRQLAPGIQGTLAAAYERALHAPDPPDALAAWFARHAEDLTCTIVLDHLENVADPAVTRFIVRAIERTPENCRWILASTTLDDVPVASWLAHGLAGAPLDEKDVALTLDEARVLARHLNPALDDAATQRLQVTARGRVADFVYLVRAVGAPGEGERSTHASVEEAILALYRSFTAAERCFAVRTSILERLEPALVRAVAGLGAHDALERLRASHPQLFADEGLRYQTRFRDFLRETLRSWTPKRRNAVVVRTASALERSGDVAGALHAFVAIRYQRGLLGLIERHGFNSIESSHASLVHDAIEALDEEARQHHFAVLALRAMSAALSGASDVAESLFQHALAACRTFEQEIRIRQLYANELLRRGRPDALTLLKPDAKFLSAPPDLRVSVMSSLGAASVLAGNLADAEKWTDRALAACDQLGDDVLSARVRHTAAWVAMNGARDARRATELATASAELADGVGAYEIASGACSVLYGIAMDLDDDPRKAASYTQRIAVYAAKCGNVEKQMFAWVASYEIEVESGNAAAAVSIQRALGEFDLQYGSRMISEALISSQVLQATWSGDFERAHRTLGVSADQQVTPDREALRWAEIAVYAAAAGAPEKAAAAVVSALRKLKSAPRDGVRTLRARLYVALAFVLLGRTWAPKLMLAAVARDLPPHRRRLRALATAIEELAAYRAGEGDHLALLRALEALHECEFGGVARMLEALPMDALSYAPATAMVSA